MTIRWRWPVPRATAWSAVDRSGSSSARQAFDPVWAIRSDDRPGGCANGSDCSCFRDGRVFDAFSRNRAPRPRRLHTPSKIARLRRWQRSTKIACAASVQSSKVRAIYGRGGQTIAEIRYRRGSHENRNNPRDSINAHFRTGLMITGSGHALATIGIPLSDISSPFGCAPASLGSG